MKSNIHDYYDLVCRRKSVRQFADKDIEEEKLSRLLEVLRCSQSAANCQPWQFIILKKAERRNFDKKVLRKESFHSAPLIIAACTEPDKAWVRRDDGANYAWVDVSIAVTEMITAATAEGLGTCWIASFELAWARKLLGVPKNIDIVALIALGYPPAPLEKEVKNRKPLEAVVHYNKW